MSQLSLFSGPSPEGTGGQDDAAQCTCILSGRELGGRASYPAGWWHERGCPRYRPPPPELMALAWRKHDRESMVWLFRHWPEERYPRAEDFPA